MALMLPLILIVQVILSNFFFPVPLFPGVYIFPPDYTPMFWVLTTLIITCNIGWTFDSAARASLRLLDCLALTLYYLVISSVQLLSSVVQFEGIRGVAAEPDYLHDVRNSICYVSIVVVLRMLGGLHVALLGAVVITLGVVMFGKSGPNSVNSWCFLLQPGDSALGLGATALLVAGAYLTYVMRPRRVVSEFAC